MADSQKYWRTFFWLTVYSMAMAYLESAVVVYLRRLYYSDGFTMTLQQIPRQTLIVEIGREAATVIMLISVAWLSGKSKAQRWSAFLFCFGVWDIFYYIWLKALLDWPASFLEWDILFLIPVLWIGPVLAPVLVSLGLILTGMVIYRRDLFRSYQRPDRISLGWIILGCGIIFLSFIIEGIQSPVNLSGLRYRWEIFGAGFVIAAGGSGEC